MITLVIWLALAIGLVILVLARNANLTRYIPRMPAGMRGTGQWAYDNRGWLLSVAITIVLGVFLWNYLPDYLRYSPLFWAVVILAGAYYTPAIFGATWNRNVFAAVAALVVFTAIAGSGIGKFTYRGYDNLVERGLGEGDWSPKLDDVRIVRDGTVVMKKGKVEEFFVVGSAKLINHNEFTCLGIGPNGVFDIQSFQGGRLNVITPKSGKKEWATVKVKPAEECGKRTKMEERPEVPLEVGGGRYAASPHKPHGQTGGFLFMRVYRARKCSRRLRGWRRRKSSRACRLCPTLCVSCLGYAQFRCLN